MAGAVIFDYGVGNLLSLKTALEKAGLNVTIGTTAVDLDKADAIALPGVGSFTAALTKLDTVKETLQTKISEGIPLLGICLGLQLFFESSEEGSGDGLAFFKGKVKQLPGTVKVPHMGWNTLNLVKPTPLFDGIAEGTYVYFVHSLYPVPKNQEIVIAKTEYGTTFTSAVADKNIYGTQFHPEKSGVVGLNILKNFAKIVVRLTKGKAETAKCYESQFGTPLEAAERWCDESAGKLHIIDLDAAFGIGDNRTVIAQIAKNISLPIQVGGGIRSYETAEKLLKVGVAQVILGSLAFSDPSVIDKIQKRFGYDSAIVALDNSDGHIMVEGWQTATAMTVDQALEKYSLLGVHDFLITSIAQDGMLTGPDLQTLSSAILYPEAKIIAAGGIGSIGDLAALKQIGCSGAVIGKALYEGRFTLKEALQKIGA
jgi:glutamine amidotransferase